MFDFKVFQGGAFGLVALGDRLQGGFRASCFRLGFRGAFGLVVLDWISGAFGLDF